MDGHEVVLVGAEHAELLVEGVALHPVKGAQVHPQAVPPAAADGV